MSNAVNFTLFLWINYLLSGLLIKSLMKNIWMKMDSQTKQTIMFSKKIIMIFKMKAKQKEAIKIQLKSKIKKI